MSLLNQPVKRWITLALLLLMASNLPKAQETPLLDTNNQLTEQQQQELEKMVAESKKQVAHLPTNLDPQKPLSDAETQQLKKSVKQSEQAITPILKQEIKELLESKQYQVNKSVGERLAREVLQLPTEATRDNQQSSAPIEGQVVVFVSASMPMETLRNYARSLVKVKGALVLRGGIEGLKKIGPTLAFSQRVLKIDPYCTENCPLFKVPLLIDPLLFHQYQITQVPAIAFQPEGLVQGCDRSTTASAADVIYGDISLKGALDRLNQLNPHPKLNNLLTQLENNHVID